MRITPHGDGRNGLKLSDLPEVSTDWTRVAPTSVVGASGKATIRARQAGSVQLRVVEYGAGYLADHWCSKGHVIYVIAGSLAIEHEDGTPPFRLASGMTWHVSDGAVPAHRVRSEHGATVFIVD